MKLQFVNWRRVMGFGLIALCTASSQALDPRADLTIYGGDFTQTCKDPEPCYISQATFTVKNTGLTDAGKSAIEVWVSDDFILDPTDTLIKRVNLGKIKAGSERIKKVGGKSFKKTKPSLTKIVLVVLDPDNAVDESNEGNLFGFT